MDKKVIKLMMDWAIREKQMNSEDNKKLMWNEMEDYYLSIGLGEEALKLKWKRITSYQKNLWR